MPPSPHRRGSMTSVIAHEVFENQRYSVRTREWGSDYPSHLGPNDPPQWTNRLHQVALAAQMEESACLPNWEWAKHSRM